VSLLHILNFIKLLESAQGERPWLLLCRHDGSCVCSPVFRLSWFRGTALASLPPPPSLRPSSSFPPAAARVAPVPRRSPPLAVHRAAAGAVLGRVNPTPCLSHFLRSLHGMNRRPYVPRRPLLPCSCSVRLPVSAPPLHLLGLAGGGPREGRLLLCLRQSAGLSVSPPPPRSASR